MSIIIPYLELFVLRLANCSSHVFVLHRFRDTRTTTWEELREGPTNCYLFGTKRQSLTLYYIRLHVDVQMSDWWEAQAARDVWRYIIMEFGEQSAMTISTILTLALSATVLDSGWYHSS